MEHMPEVDRVIGVRKGKKKRERTHFFAVLPAAGGSELLKPLKSADDRKFFGAKKEAPVNDAKPRDTYRPCGIQMGMPRNERAWRGRTPNRYEDHA